MPRRSSRPSSPRQPRRTRTDEVEVHLDAELALELAPRGGADRLDHPALGADQDALLGLGLHPGTRLHADEILARVVDLLDDDLDRVRHLLERAPQHLLADELGEQHLVGLVGGVVDVEENGPSGSSATRCSTSASTPVPLRADSGKISSPTSSSAAACSAASVWARSRRSILLTRRRPAPGRARGAGDEAVAGADALLAVEDHQRGVGVGRARARRATACAASARRAGAARRAGRRARAGASPRVATPRIARRVVCGLSETIATLLPDDRVDERRLADVRPPGERRRTR